MKEPTWTSLVERALRGRDDFMDYRMLMEATGAGYNQVNAACWCLRLRRVVDVVIEPSGKAWWFVLPPELDQRHRKPRLRQPELRPRKRRVSYVLVNGVKHTRCDDGYDQHRRRCVLPKYHEGGHKYKPGEVPDV